MQHLRIGSTVNITTGTPQSSDISTEIGATVTNLTSSYIEYEASGSSTGTVRPWHRVLNVAVTTP